MSVFTICYTSLRWLQFAGFDPFKRSEYFGPLFDLGQVHEC
jgi:hypothetical protein